MQMAMNQVRKVKVKKKRVTRRELLENVRRIQDALKSVTEGTDEYERLSRELEHEYVILRKYMDSRLYIEPKQYLLIAGGVIVTVFFVCLEREVPSVTKFVNMMFRIMPFRG